MCEYEDNTKLIPQCHCYKFWSCKPDVALQKRPQPLVKYKSFFLRKGTDELVICDCHWQSLIVLYSTRK